MTHYVYGLRNVGSAEIRYVGQTSKTGDFRLQYEQALARKRSTKSGWDVWLLGGDGAVEAVPIVICADEAEARKQERAVIGVLTAIGHRLFNVQWRPKAIEPYQPRTPATSPRRRGAEA